MSRLVQSPFTWKGQPPSSAGKGCVIYPVRPAQCRTWPFWESNLRSRKNWDSIAEGCPGIGRGPLIGVDEIVSRMREFRI